MSGQDATRHQLSAEENRAIFATAIVRDLLTGPTPQGQAVAAFVVGQPGVGKTRVADLVGERLYARGGFVDVDSDLYKPYHPRYAQLMAEDDQLMALYTGPDGRAWMRQAQQYVRGEGPLSGGRKLNALIQETAMDPQFLAGTLRQYRAVGTRTEVAVLAVAQALSEQGILNRYLEQVRDRGHGRLTVPEKAAASYRGILVSCEVLVREGLVDYGAVYRRGEVTPRFAADAAGLARDPLALRQAVERERLRPLTPEESREFLAVQRKLREGLPGFGSQLDRINKLAEPIVAPRQSSGPRVSTTAARSRSTTSRPVRPPDESPASADPTTPRYGPEGPPAQHRGQSK